MKKQFIARFFASLAATCATTFLLAQYQNAVPLNRSESDQINAAISTFEKAGAASEGTGVYVKAKVMRSFVELFQNASEVTWSAHNNRYFAGFKQDGKLCKALFDSQGGLLFSLWYGTEKDLPRDVRRLLKSTYIDFAIGVVTEVNTADIHAWVANLTDSDNLIVASVHDGSLVELQHYQTH